jgi:hypothetical protein
MEITFRGQTAAQIIPAMVGQRLDGAMADLTEVTLTNLFKIALRRGSVAARRPEFAIYHQGSGEFDARFCCETPTEAHYAPPF